MTGDRSQASSAQGFLVIDRKRVMARRRACAACETCSASTQTPAIRTRNLRAPYVAPPCCVFCGNSQHGGCERMSDWMHPQCLFATACLVKSGPRSAAAAAAPAATAAKRCIPTNPRCILPSVPGGGVDRRNLLPLRRGNHPQNRSWRQDCERDCELKSAQIQRNKGKVVPPLPAQAPTSARTTASSCPSPLLCVTRTYV